MAKTTTPASPRRSPKAASAPKPAAKAATKSAAKPVAAAATKRRKVDFSVQDPAAHEAAIAGTFNDWQPQPLKPAPAPGIFSLTLMLPPGDYEYRFVIDGQWRCDAACPECVPNPFGEANSVLHVA